MSTVDSVTIGGQVFHCRMGVDVATHHSDRVAEGSGRGGVLRGMDTSGSQRLSPVDLRARLGLLELERAVAQQSPLADDPRYMADLFAEIDAIQAAYAGGVVIEIARLRADLDGRLYG
jgi:hypothetical protein